MSEGYYGNERGCWGNDRYNDRFCRDVPVGEAYADIVKTVKDSEAQLHLAEGNRVAGIVSAVRDAEAAAAAAHCDLAKGVKDAESTLSQQHCDLIGSIKEAEATLDKSVSEGTYRTMVGQSILDKSVSDGVHRNADGQTNLLTESLKGQSLTREKIWKSQNKVQEEIGDAKTKLIENGHNAFRETMVGFKDAQSRAFELFGKQEERACNDKARMLLEFKDVAIAQRELACQQAAKLAECCCELKELIRAENAQTRAVIAQNELDKVRDRANNAEAKLAAYFAADKTPTSP